MSDSSQERIKSAARLNDLGRNLTLLAKENELTHIYEREEEILQLANLLSIGEMSVLLVGDSGVGKNAIVEGLAKWMNLGDNNLTANQKVIMHASLANKSIIEVNPEDFQYDCYYVHEFESKIKYIINECKMNKVILFIDNINMAISAGASGQSPERNLANLLNRYLSSKELIVIGATSNEGYKTMMKKNSDFTKRFNKMEITEATPQKTTEILLHLQNKLETKYSVEINCEIFELLIDLAHRFYPDKAFPGKAIDILIEAISSKAMTDRSLVLDDIYNVVRSRTGFPEKIIHRYQALSKEHVSVYFQERLFGQDYAIDLIADSILTYKSELNNSQKPIDTFLFVGPTGVGKTELAKLLAEYLFGNQDRLHKYDMANYVGIDGLMRLCAGSKSINEPGKLFSETMANPYCVTLFDEIEKASTEIFNFLLPVLDEGKLVDEAGRVAYFNNSIIIMTSNLGSNLYKKKPITFGPNSLSVSKEDIFKIIKEHFNPEFINRIGHIIYFSSLSHDNVAKIIKKELNKILNRSGISLRELEIDIREGVIDSIANKAYSLEYGARAIQREISDIIIKPLSELLSTQPSIKDRRIVFDIAEGEVILRNEAKCFLNIQLVK
jgi:ATP-dependent Clp protease ATP-binding subunit ClpC